jgi:hypothetical protein
MSESSFKVVTRFSRRAGVVTIEPVGPLDESAASFLLRVLGFAAKRSRRAILDFRQVTRLDAEAGDLLWAELPRYRGVRLAWGTRSETTYFDQPGGGGVVADLS